MFPRTVFKRRFFTRRNLTACLCVLLIFSLVSFLEINNYPEKKTHESHWTAYNEESTNGKRIVQYQDGGLFQTDCGNLNIKGSIETNLLPSGTDIYIYSTKQDKWVSTAILETGSWKGNLSEQILKLMRPDTVLIDLGAHVGTISLPVALAGHHVIAVDIIKSSLDLLCKTAQKHNILHHFTLINNAVSGGYDKTFVDVPENNVAGSNVEVVTRKLKFIKYDQTKLIDSIPIRALLPLIKHKTVDKNVVLKMSLEGHEYQVIKTASEFFKQVNVRYVIVEFSKHKRAVSGIYLRDTLRKFGMEAELDEKLRTEKYPIRWPDTVIWRRVHAP